MKELYGPVGKIAERTAPLHLSSYPESGLDSFMKSQVLGEWNPVALLLTCTN